MQILEATSVNNLVDQLKLLNLPENLLIRVIIERGEPQAEEDFQVQLEGKSARYLFLNDNVWEGDNTPTDLAENHDDYLYDMAERISNMPTQKLVLPMVSPL
jgi:hypothetical protein